MMFDWDWTAAERAFRRASQLNPNHSSFWYAVYLAARGRHEESIAEAQRAQRADPLSPIVSAGLAWMFHLARQPDRALSKPSRRASPFSGGHADNLAAIGYIYAVSGNREQAQQVLERLKEMAREGYLSAYNFALVYTGLGDQDRAFQWLQAALEERSRAMVLLNVEPAFDPLRSNPRFRDLVRRIGLGP